MSKPEYNREFIYTVPESIFLDATLTLTDMKVYMFIRSFMDSHRECFASNRWFSEKLEVTRRTIISSLIKLENKGYIVRSEINNTRILTTKRNALKMTDDNNGDLKRKGGDLDFTGCENEITGCENEITGGCNSDHGGGDLDFISNSIEVKENDQKLLLPCEDQILHKDLNPEPVVVLTDSSTPTPTPKNLVNRVNQDSDDVLLTAYRAKPVYTENILCEEDFLSACDWLINDRGDISLRGRIKGIVGFVNSGGFEEPVEWAREQRARKNREKGEANSILQEQNTRTKAPILTKAKGREACLAEAMAKIDQNRKETTKEPVYLESTYEKNLATNRKFTSFAKLPDKEQEIMFQPDVSLLKQDEEE